MDNIFEALGFAFKGKVSMEETASDHFEQIPTAVDPQETATFIDKLEDDHEGVNQERRADETLPEENVADEIAREIEAIEKEGALDENLSGEGNDIMDIPENPKAEKMGGIAPVASDEERAPEVIEKIKENSKPNQTTIDDTGFAGNKEVEHMMAEQNGQEYAEHNENQSVFSDAENETEVTSADKMYVQVPGENGYDEFKSLDEAQGDHGSTETNDTPGEKKSVRIGDIQGDTSTILDADGGVEDASGSGDYDSTDEYSDETDEVEEEDPDVIKFSLIGRPNVGKSSLINAILGEDRVIASPVAGTTRDAIDTHFTDADGQEFTMIDTAGMRKSGKVYENTEKYSVMRAMRAIDRSDVVLMVLNAEEGIREYDKRIAGFAHEAGKGMIIVVNKWDTLEKDNHTMKNWEEDIREQFQYLPYAPIIFVSALTKQRLHKLPEMIKQISESQNTRIPSAVLNDVIMDAIAINPTPTDKGKRLKIFYATQVATKPPTFVIFVNEEELMHFSYLRFLENQIRKAFVFEGTPIHLIARKRK